MKKHLIFSTVLTCLASGLFAQSLPERQREETYVMSDAGVVGVLDLDTAQVRNLLTIERRYDRDFNQLMRSDSLSEELLATRVDAISQQRHDGIRAILTLEQYERWSRMIAEADMP